MKCLYPKDQIALFVESDLCERDRRTVERHLLVCDHCRTFADEVRQSQAVFKSLRAETVSPSSLKEVRDRVLARIDDAEVSLAWALRLERLVFAGLRRRYVVAGVLAALVLALTVGVLWGVGSGAPAPAGPAAFAEVTAPNPDAEAPPEPSSSVVEEPASDPPARPLPTHPPALARPPASPPTPQPADIQPADIQEEIPALAWQDLPLIAAAPPPPPAILDVLPPIELPEGEPDQILVKMLTVDPEIVIYWVVDPDDPIEGGI